MWHLARAAESRTRVICRETTGHQSPFRPHRLRKVALRQFRGGTRNGAAGSEGVSPAPLLITAVSTGRGGDVKATEVSGIIQVSGE